MTMKEPNQPTNRREPKSLDRPAFREPLASVELQKPVALSPLTMDDLICWVAAVPVSKSDVIHSQIALVAQDIDVVEALVAELFRLPVTDFGYHLLLLSTLGEMRNPRAIEPLLRFIWYKDSLVVMDED